MDFVIAVDGTAASGKGTIAKGLARAFALPYLDTGLLYRAVGRAVAAAGFALEDAPAAAKIAAALTTDDLEDEELRAAAAGEAASRVAAHPEVRAALVALQRRFAEAPGGAVLDGRDIGTVIAPGAPAKLYVDARLEVRAARRLRQLGEQDDAAAVAAMAQDLARRDARDQQRASAPLKRAADAVLLDTSEMAIDDAADAARRIVETARARWLDLQTEG